MGKGKKGKGISRREFVKVSVAAAAGVALSPLIKIPPVSGADVVKIGFPTGLTGMAGPWMVHVKKAVDLVVEEYNASGGVKSLGGAKIEVSWADTQSNPITHQNEVEKMINVSGIKLFLSGASALSMVGSAITDKYGAIMVDLGTADQLTERNLKYFFNTSIKASDNAHKAVEFGRYLYETRGKKFTKVGVIHSDDAFGAAAGRAMEAGAKKVDGWEFVERIAYSPAKLVGGGEYIEKMKGQGVEVLFQASTPESGIILQQAVKTAGYNPQANIHAHGAPYLKGYVDSLGKDAEYVFCDTQFVADMISKYPKHTQEFLKRFAQKYGEPINDNSACGATTVITLIDAIERAKSTDPDKVRDALMSTNLNVNSYPYIVAGPGVKFDQSSHRNVAAETNMHQIQGGVLRCVWPDTFKTADPVYPVPKWNERR